MTSPSSEPMTIDAMSKLKEWDVQVRTGGGVCFPLPIPSTGSMPIMAENLRFVEVFNFLRARANAVLPPRLWPESASLV